MTQDRPLLGILLMLGFCIVAPIGDAVAKVLGETIPVGELLLIRFAIQVVLLLPLVWLTRRPWRVSGTTLWLVVLRTVLHIFGIGAMFAALRYLPLADAIAIAFVMPFIMLLLGKMVLGEEVGRRRMLACLVGFIGTLFVVQPSFVEVGWPALLPLVVAVNFSMFILITRKIAKTTDPIGLQTVSGVMAVVMIIPILLLFQNSNVTALVLKVPTTFEYVLLLAIGCLGTLAHLLMTWSLRFAPSTMLAPMQYLEIPIATVIGFFVFSDLPNNLATMGIVIIMAAGLYVVIRERSIASTPVPSAKPEPSPRPVPVG